MKDTKLYNLIFPLWFAMFFPPLVFVVLLGNLIIDGAIIYLTLRVSGLVLPRKSLWSLIIKAWLAGFAAELIGVFLLLLTMPLVEVTAYNIWTDGPLAIAVYLAVVALVGVIIYYWNRYLCKRHGIPQSIVHRVGLLMGTITAPWLFVVPTPF